MSVATTPIKRGGDTNKVLTNNSKAAGRMSKLSKTDNQRRTIETTSIPSENNSRHIIDVAPPDIASLPFRIDYEDILVDKREEIANDPLKFLLLFPDTDLEIASVPHESRTVGSSVPAVVKKERDLEYFMTESANFFESDYSIVRRTQKALSAPAPAGVSSVLPDEHVFEVDIRSNGIEGMHGNVDEGARIVSSRQMLYYKSPSLNFQGKGAKKIEALPQLSKFKKRRVDLQSVDGVLSLEVYKDGSDKILDSVTLEKDNAQVTEGATTMMRVSSTSGLVYIHMDSAPACKDFVDLIEDELARLARPPSSTPSEPPIQRVDKTEPHRHLDDNELERLYRHSVLTPPISQSLFGIYNPDSNAISTEQLQGPDPPPFVEVMGFRFVVTCRQLLFDLQSSPSKNVEPLYCSLALYDVREGSKSKLSENFYFDVPDTVNPLSGTASSTPSQALFSVEEMHDQVYVLLLVEKVLQGSIDSMADVYSKPSYKADEHTRNSLRAHQSHLGHLRMPLAWAARPVFARGTSELDTTSAFSPLFKQDSARLCEEDLLRNLSELHRSLTNNSKPKFAVLPGVFSVGVCAFDYAEPTQTLSHNGLPLKPMFTSGLSLLSSSSTTPPISPSHPSSTTTTLKAGSNSISSGGGGTVYQRREVFAFPQGIIQNPRITYVNYLFVYPKHINMSAKQTRFRHNKNVRNILVQVQLYETDEHGLRELGEGLKCIYSRTDNKLVTQASVPVSHHTEWARYYDEIKIELPPNLTDRHHLFFTFFHVVVGSKKKDREKKMPFGFAFLPILDTKRRQVSGDLELQVANVEHRYGDDILPRNYTHCQTIGGAGNASNSSTADARLTDLKWLERDAPVFRVSCRPVSTVYPNDDHLRKFFRLCQETDWGRNVDRSDAVLSSAIKALHALPLSAANTHTPSASATSIPMTPSGHKDLRDLVTAFPVIFNALMRLLPSCPADSDIGCNIVQFMTFAVSEIGALPPGGLSSPLSFGVFSTGAAGAAGGAGAGTGGGVTGTGVTSIYSNTGSMLFSPTSPTATGAIGGAGAPAKKNTLLDTYLFHVFRAPKLSTGRTVHAELVRCILTILTDRTRYEKLAEQLCHHVSFFLLLIWKSMVQSLAADDLLTAHRKLRFPDEYLVDLRKLVQKLVEAMEKMAVNDPSKLIAFNTSLAAFLSDCFAVLDRGYVMSLVKLTTTIQSYLAIRGAFSLLTSCKLDLLWHLCNHEHYIPLNLPLLSQVAALGEPGEQPYLTGMLLTELSSLLSLCVDKFLLRKVLTMVRLLLVKHDTDPRYQNPACKTRISMLYFPLVRISIHHLDLLHATVTRTDNLSHDASSTDPDGMEGVPENVLDIAEIRELLMTVLYVLRHCDQKILRVFLSSSAAQFFKLLDVCTRVFRYKGQESFYAERHTTQTQALKKIIEFPVADKNWRDKRVRTVSAVLGSPTPSVSGAGPVGRPRVGSTNTTLERLASSASTLTNNGLNGPRSRISTMPSVYMSNDEVLNGPTDKALAGAISHESGLIMANQIMRFIDDGFGNAPMVAKQSVANLILLMLRLGQSEDVSCQLTYTLRRLIDQYSAVVFNPELDFCAALCKQLLLACNSSLSSLQYSAVVLLYALLEKNFPKASLHASIAISELDAESSTMEDLRLSLSSLARLARIGQLTKEVGMLAERLRTILHSTQQLKMHRGDPEMYIDLMCRIADSYSHSPQLRLVWLKNIAKEHVNNKCWVEAAMCCVHAGSLVCEALKTSSELLKDGCEVLSTVTPNIVAEKGHELDFTDLADSSALFSERGVVSIFRKAIDHFKTAQCFELVSRIYYVILPLLERDRRFEDLARACDDMRGCFSQIVDLSRTNKRRLGTYYLVKFFGKRFGPEMDGVQLIYREPLVTPLSEISLRLQKQFQTSFGADKVVMITDSKDVDASELCEDFAYMQIVFVEPYFTIARDTYFEQNHNISLFVYETPFTKSGKAHGSVLHQWKRKTIVHVANSTFPCVRKRLLVDRVEATVELSPIEVAIEEIQRKVVALRTVLSSVVVDMKMLQMQIQGTVSLQVNAGPMEIATSFLGNRSEFDQRYVQDLITQFDELLYLLYLGIAKNERLVQADQREYHRDLATRFGHLVEQLRAHFTPTRAFHTLDVDAELLKLRPFQDPDPPKFLDDNEEELAK